MCVCVSWSDQGWCGFADPVMESRTLLWSVLLRWWGNTNLQLFRPYDAERVPMTPLPFGRIPVLFLLYASCPFKPSLLFYSQSLSTILPNCSSQNLRWRIHLLPCFLLSSCSLLLFCLLSCRSCLVCLQFFRRSCSINKCNLVWFMEEVSLGSSYVTILDQNSLPQLFYTLIYQWTHIASICWLL